MIIFKLCFLFLVQDSSSKKFLVETVDEYFDTSPPPYGEQEDPVEPVAPIHRGKGVCQSTLPCQVHFWFWFRFCSPWMCYTMSLGGNSPGPSYNLLSPDWVKSVEPCSYGRFTSSEGEEFTIERKESGPVTINGFKITDEAHKQALSGESSLLFMEDKAVKLKLTSPGVLTFGDQKLPGSKGVDFSMLGMPSQPIDHDC
ncbi:uncharacterized protein LOC111713010 isoform X2 [Eurytemora carolleeae]|uniref:uncharacterized protein LOC111713010 isoform X2 n=1 Tax=Eurytemora carolleeae TaxID=1294199 RepID=UPI000C77ECF4|nr:uncharacterized protein LOC111713010 isoform X2 [Eurytemora carolleeae]|eukprot:XP_023343556.1 uncharacterized protein LOC111713010 isoform X2 [Eurytemora affinis]